MPYEPRPYQLDVVERVRGRMAAGARRVLLQAATGAGKTVIGGHITDLTYRRGKKIAFFAHRRRLVDQISATMKEFGLQHGIIMRGEAYARESPIQVISIDTFQSRMVDNEWMGLPEADLVIVDEARHSLAPVYQNVLNNIYPNAYVLGLDATPVMPDGTGLGPWYQAIECAVPTSRLVKDGYLVPVTCYAPDRMGKRRRAGKYVKGIAGDLVDSWQDYAQGLPTIVFCSRVEHSLDAVSRFTEAGIRAAHIDADTPDRERETLINQLEAGFLQVICNVGIFGEGVDVPALGCCVFWCNVSSRVRFLQGCGRIMRPYPGKTRAILIDHAGAVIQHGFPDEDMEWPLLGNANGLFAERQKKGDTETVRYCPKCELQYSGGLECPQCGRLPEKPPRSIFAAPEQDAEDDILVEQDRKQSPVQVVEEKRKHWVRCVAAQFYRGSTFGSALKTYQTKYPTEFPADNWPFVPPRSGWKARIADVYPNFGKRGRKDETGSS